MPTVGFVTYGCRINQYDSQAIRRAVLELGYESVPDESAEREADVIVVNACTVTNHAGERGVATVRRLARRRPDAKVIVTGCIAPEDRAVLERIPHVSHVVGNEEKDQIPALLQGAALERVTDRRNRSILGMRADEFSGKTRAFVKVHDGCDDFCTYCIIPFVRGKSKSRPLADVFAEARRFAERGHREVVVTGIHLRRYGADLGLDDGIVQLVRGLRQIPGVDRVRLSSIGMKAFTPQFLELWRSDPGLCDYFHIPLQSGSKTVLERMRREYSSEEYLETVERIRRALPDAVLTTDWMIGFPGETEAEFDESMSTVERARFGFVHIFPYSMRTGTKAAKRTDQVPMAVKRQRLDRARELERQLVDREGERWLGRSVQVLVERLLVEKRAPASTNDGSAFVDATGTSREGHRVRFRAVADDVIAPDRAIAAECQVEITGHEGRLHLGQWKPPTSKPVDESPDVESSVVGSPLDERSGNVRPINECSGAEVQRASTEVSGDGKTRAST